MVKNRSVYLIISLAALMICPTSMPAWAAPPAAVSIAVGDVNIVEGNTGKRNAIVVVSLNTSSKKTVSVNYGTANGTATAGSDYDAVSGKLTFAPGETSKSILVPVRGDQLVESNEAFFVNLSGAKQANIADSQAVVTIVDDDDTRPRIGINDVWAQDGDSGTTPYTFTVSLSAACVAAVTVNYATADGTATTADSDYLATSGTLTFAPGETTKSITVDVIGHASGGPTPDSGYAESFFVNLSSASSDALIGDGQGVGTIHYYDRVPGVPGEECTPDHPNYPLCN